MPRAKRAKSSGPKAYAKGRPGILKRVQIRRWNVILIKEVKNLEVGVFGVADVVVNSIKRRFLGMQTKKGFKCTHLFDAAKDEYCIQKPRILDSKSIRKLFTVKIPGR